MVRNAESTAAKREPFESMCTAHALGEPIRALLARLVNNAARLGVHDAPFQPGRSIQSAWRHLRSIRASHKV